LEDFVEKISDKKLSPEQKTELKLNIIKIPPILLDNTDRNRTSPFAFTGNKFEFRSVGSADNCAAAMIALNTAMASQLTKFKQEVDTQVDKGFEKDEAMYIVLKSTYNKSKKRIFGGNGYGEEWIAEAKTRGLSNISNTPDALSAYLTKEVIELFESQHILSCKEIEARYEIKMEKYFKKIQIESRVIADMVQNHIIPCALTYQNVIIQNVQGLKSLFSESQFQLLASEQIRMIEEISKHSNELLLMINQMTEERRLANLIPQMPERAQEYKQKVVPFFDAIRNHTDKLELIVSDEEWVLPKYRELLFMN
jgi:glutamine synthetase